MWSLVAQFAEKLLLVEVAVFVEICFLDEFQDIVVADVDVEVLVEDRFNFVEADQSSFLAVEEGEHVEGLFLPAAAEEPLFGDEFDDLGEGEGVFVLVGAGDLVFDLFAVHFGEGEVAEDGPEVLSVDVAGVGGVVEGEGVFDLVFLSGRIGTISSVSLLLTLAFLPLPWLIFLLGPISYKIIVFQIEKQNLLTPGPSPGPDPPIFTYLIKYIVWGEDGRSEGLLKLV